MKLGKAKLKRILSDETGIPIKDITIYGRYEISFVPSDPRGHGRRHL